MRLTILLLAALLAPPAAARGGGPAGSDGLPEGYVSTDGREPLYLRVVDAAGTPVLLPVGEADATLTVAFVERTREMTVVSLTSGMPHTLKVDLHISPDGERWSRTSSCPLPSELSGFESWPYAVPHLALANPRWLDDDAAMTCE